MATGDAPPSTLYWCMVLLGCGTLFPWNAFISAADYWEARFPGAHTDRLLTISYLPVNLAVIAAMVRLHGRISTRLRVLGGLAGFTATVATVPLLDLAPPSRAALAAVVLLAAACGACDGVAQGALFGEAALLPPRYTQALCSGTAVSGVGVSLLRIVTKATLPDTEAGLRRSAALYFATAALVCAACTAVYSWVLPHLPEAQQYRRAALGAAAHEHSSSVGEADGVVLAAGPDWKPGRDEPQHWQQQQQQEQLPRQPSLGVELSLGDWQQRRPQQDGTSGQRGDEAAHTLLLPGQLHSSSGAGLHGRGTPRQHEEQQQAQWPGGGGLLAPAGSGSSGSGQSSAAAVLRSIWRPALSTTLVYVVTLSIFPGVLAEDVKSAALGSWYPVALLSLFNVADYVGKSAPALPALRLRDERLLLALVASRLLFVPAFHLAAVWGGGPPAMGLLTLALGASNGHLTACAMMEGAAAAPPGAAELAGNLMVLSLILGLCIGAAAGFLWLLV